MTRTAKTHSNDFVAGGYTRALEAIEADVRPNVENKYAADWNASGLVKRWLLLRRIEREIADGVAERS